MANNNLQLNKTEEEENAALCSQENDGEIDVVWEWNSSHCKYRKRSVMKKQGTCYSSERSPSITFKRHNADTNIPVFNKLKEQMGELLKNSATAKNTFDDHFFDDSIDEELVLCSQRAEEECLQKQKQVVSEDLADDSFDLVLQQLDDDKIESLVQPTHMQPIKCERLLPPPVKMEQFTQSASVSEVSPEEMKQKRLQALEELQAKRPVKMEEFTHSASVSEISPVKCSPEEIEQKRLQALEKLQAKRKQGIIERNRQEALKRLERNKKKATGLPRKLSVIIK